MEEKERRDAIDLFQQKFNMKPADYGYAVIDKYERQRAFLYACDHEVVKAYKKQQNIRRWVMSWYLIQLTVAVLIYFVSLFIYQNFWNPLCIAGISYWIALVILFNVLWFMDKRISKLIKLNENITFLNYK